MCAGRIDRDLPSLARLEIVNAQPHPVCPWNLASGNPDLRIRDEDFVLERGPPRPLVEIQEREVALEPAVLAHEVDEHADRVVGTRIPPDLPEVSDAHLVAGPDGL